MNRPSRIVARRAVAFAMFMVGIVWLPYAWHARLVERWFSGDAKLQTKLANGVEYWIRQGFCALDRTCRSTILS